MVKFFDQTSIHERIDQGLRSRIDVLFEHGQYLWGPEVAELEGKLAEFVGVKHAITCANGTDALILALLACVPQQSGEVITPAFSYFASCETIDMKGYTPKFVDIERRTYNIDPDQIESQITENTVAILGVDLFGQCMKMDQINEIARKYNLPVIEDAAQSFGATINGARAGSLSTVGCTSFFPTKPLSCYGDGGACFTNDDEIAKTIRRLANHGQSSEPHKHTDIGFNSRLDSIQAAVLLEKFAIFEDTLHQRRTSAAYYAERLAGIDGIELPEVGEGHDSAYAQFTIQADQCDQLCAYLADAGIQTAKYYPLTLPQQPAIARKYGYPSSGTHPNAEAACQRVLSLPIYAGIDQDQQDIVIDKIVEFLAGSSR